MAKKKWWAVLVIWEDGTEEYLKAGVSGSVARFHSREAANDQADFVRMGIEDECQSVSVVNYPD